MSATKLALSLLFLTATAAATYAQDSTASPSQTPRSPNTVATESRAPRVAPTQTLDARFIEQTLAALEFQTKRAEALEAQATAWKKQSDEWRALYDSEHQRAELLASAGIDRRDAQTSLAKANLLFQAQHDEDRATIADLNAQVRALEKSRLKWTLGSLVVGAGVGATYRK